MNNLARLIITSQNDECDSVQTIIPTGRPGLRSRFRPAGPGCDRTLDRQARAAGLAKSYHAKRKQKLYNKTCYVYRIL